MPATSRGASQRPRAGPSRRRSIGGNVRHGARAETRVQLQPGVTPLLGVDARLDRGRRGGKHDRGFLDPGAHHRHVAGMVDDAIFLLVGALVLLIDDDQPEIARTAGTVPSARRPRRAPRRCAGAP